MPIRVTCPSCKRNFPVLEGFVHRTDRCPHCDAVIRLQSEFTSEAGASAAIVGAPSAEMASRDAEGGSWRTYARGLAFLQGAAAVGLAALLLGLVEWSMSGNDPRDAPEGPNEIFAGLGLAMLIAGTALAIIGRIACIKAPDAPARAMAKGALILTLAATAFLVVASIATCVALFAGPEAKPIAADAEIPRLDPQVIVALAVYGALLWMLAGIVGEALGHRSLMHAGSRLDDRRTQHSGRTMFLSDIVTAGGVVLALVAVTIVVAAELAQTDTRPAVTANGDNSPDGQEQLIRGVLLGLGLLYLSAYIITCQAGRSAICRATEGRALIPRAIMTPHRLPLRLAKPR